MTPHTDFWVAISTAAPVIALAAIVSIGDVLKKMTRSVMGNADPTPNRLLKASYILNVVNIVMQGLILYYSLQSLVTTTDKANTLLIISGTIAGLGLLILATLLSWSASLISGTGSESEDRT